MRNNEKISLLVQAARLYYEHDYNQQMIADKLGISRPYVSKLIYEARTTGIVDIKINDPVGVESDIEVSVRNRFGLRKVIAVPSLGSGSIPEKLGTAVARLLHTIVKDNDIIGVAWGETLHECSKKMTPKDDLKNITVVQLCGGISNLERNIFASEIPKNIADAYKGIPYILPLPAVVDSIGVKNAILQDRNIQNILDIGMKANIEIFTMGVIGHDGALAKAGYISTKEIDILLDKGAVGDICTRIIDINGDICDEGLNNRTIAIELDQLKQKEYRIGVASGDNKVKCIVGALRGGFLNILVTDEETAQKVMIECEE